MLIKYKDKEPVNLDNVNHIQKVNVKESNSKFRIRFKFNNSIEEWIFDNEDEFNNVYSTLESHYFTDINPESTQKATILNN